MKPFSRKFLFFSLVAAVELATPPAMGEFDWEGADTATITTHDPSEAVRQAQEHCDTILGKAVKGDSSKNLSFATPSNNPDTAALQQKGNMSAMKNSMADEADQIQKARDGIQSQIDQAYDAISNPTDPSKVPEATQAIKSVEACRELIDKQITGRNGNLDASDAVKDNVDGQREATNGSKTDQAPTDEAKADQANSGQAPSETSPSKQTSGDAQDPSGKNDSSVADTKGGNTDTSGGKSAGNGGGSGGGQQAGGSGQQQGSGSGSGGGGGGMPDLSGLASALANQPQQTPTPTPTPQLTCTAGVVGCVCPPTNPNCAASSTASAAAGLYPAIGNPAYSPSSATTGTATTSRALLSPEAKKSVIDRMIEQAPGVIATHDGAPAPKAVLLTKAVQAPAVTTPVAVAAKAAPVKAVAARAATKPQVTAKKSSTTRTRTVAAKKSKAKRAVASTSAPVRTKIQAVSK